MGRPARRRGRSPHEHPGRRRAEPRGSEHDPPGPPELDRFSIPCIRWQVYARAVTATGSDQLQGRRATPLRVAVRSRCCADRLRAAGKRPEVMIVAVMRKLLLLAWALLRSGTPFSPTYAQGARWAAD